MASQSIAQEGLSSSLHSEKATDGMSSENMTSAWDTVRHLTSSTAAVELVIMSIKGSLKEFDTRVGLLLPDDQLTPRQWCVRIICDQQNYKESSLGKPLWANGARVFVNPKHASEVPRMLMENGFFGDEATMCRFNDNGTGTLLKPYHAIMSPQLCSIIGNLIYSRKLSLQNVISDEIVFEAILTKHRETPCGIQISWPHISNASCAAVNQWNDAHPAQKIHVGDLLLEVNGNKDIDVMQNNLSGFVEGSGEEINLKLKRSQITRVTSSAISAAESDMLRHTASEVAESDMADSQLSRLTASSGARPKVPLSTSNQWSSDARMHFEDPSARNRDYGRTNKYQFKRANWKMDEDSSNVEPSLLVQSPSPGDANGGPDDQDEYDQTQIEEDSGNPLGMQQQQNSPGLLDGESVADSLASLDLLYLKPGSSDGDLLELGRQFKTKLENISLEERWHAFVDQFVRPVLEKRIIAESLPEASVLSKQTFRDDMSKLIRIECFGKDKEILSMMFKDTEAANLPFASTFKALWNAAHSEWKCSMFSDCNQQSSDKIISELCQILKKVYSRAYADHYGSEEEDETPTVIAKMPVNLVSINASAGSKRALKKGQKLPSISEDSASTSKYEKKHMQGQIQTSVIAKWVKGDKSPSQRQTGSVQTWGSTRGPGDLQLLF